MRTEHRREPRQLTTHLNRLPSTNLRLSNLTAEQVIYQSSIVYLVPWETIQWSATADMFRGTDITPILEEHDVSSRAYVPVGGRLLTAFRGRVLRLPSAVQVMVGEASWLDRETGESIPSAHDPERPIQAMAVIEWGCDHEFQTVHESMGFRVRECQKCGIRRSYDSSD